MAETTFAVTSGVDHEPLDSLTSAADHVAATCLADTPVGLVGLELEAHCFDVADPSRRPEPGKAAVRPPFQLAWDEKPSKGR